MDRSDPNYTLPRAPGGGTLGERKLTHNDDGIRVWGESEQPQFKPPPRETYTPHLHIQRHIPPPEPLHSSPIRIPNNTPGTPLHTSFYTTPPISAPHHIPYLYGSSPHSYPIPEPLTQGFENLRLSSERSSRDTFHSHSTDNSGDRSAGSRRPRRGSLREEEFKFPIGSGERGSDAYMHREDLGRRHHRRRSSNGQAFLSPSAFSAGHSRQTSEESVFLPAEDIPRPRRNSLRERDHTTGYAAQQPYAPTSRGGVTVHQTAYRLAEVTGAREVRSEGPLPVVWIAVMGVTGSGKSTFIQTATGDRSVGVNHGLRSCTREVEVHSVRIDGFQVNLIDTPGFDDNKRSETEVFQTISTYLAKAITNQVFLNGIIYIHSIIQTRMGGSGIRSLGILERLTGGHNMDNILLVSNMWDALKGTVNNDGQRLTGQEVGELRESELRMNPEFWKGLIDQGAHTSRHRGGSWESAHELIRRFLYPDANRGVGRPMKLLLQEELVDQHKRLEETKVGNYINERLYEEQQKLEKEIAEVRRKHQRALDGAGISTSPSEIGSQLEEKKKGLNDVRRKSEILGKRVEHLIDDQGNKVTTPIGRTSGTHAGLCKMM